MPGLFPGGPAQFDPHQITDAPANFVDNRFRTGRAKGSDFIDDTGREINALSAGLNVARVGEQLVSGAAIIQFSVSATPTKRAARWWLCSALESK